MQWGIVLLIVLATTTLFQLLQQGAETRRRQRELDKRLARLEEAVGRLAHGGEDETRGFATPDSMD
jgi:hypothetical protein